MFVLLHAVHPGTGTTKVWFNTNAILSMERGAMSTSIRFTDGTLPPRWVEETPEQIIQQMQNGTPGVV